MFSQSKIIYAWCFIASIYTTLSLAATVGEKYFSGSSIPWFVGIIIGCFITWEIERTFKKAERKEKLPS
ncbi:hypothetical protein [Enterobacter sp. C2]|uniref:hypothetical protein n=1 Tax=Enterobacter sp. C2 TaxID=2870346 RepID=UPI001CA401A6|nr:hypothetical protein [Enterobacter sp. C2]